MRTTYFSYGLNLDIEQMRHRCPQAVCRGIARLLDHRFMVNLHGVASVVPAVGSIVHGLLWMLSSADMLALDEFEGVEAGFYRKRIVRVRSDEGEINALIYLAANTTPGRPRPGYLEAVVEAARSHRLPEEYIDQLLRWQVR